MHLYAIEQMCHMDRQGDLMAEMVPRWSRVAPGTCKAQCACPDWPSSRERITTISMHICELD
jgi:hypothetical protein